MIFWVKTNVGFCIFVQESTEPYKLFVFVYFMYIVQKPTGIFVCFCISPIGGYKTYTTNPTNKLKIKYTNAGIKKHA